MPTNMLQKLLLFVSAVVLSVFILLLNISKANNLAQFILLILSATVLIIVALRIWRL